MYVAIAALLITSIKCSGEMLRALHAVPVHADATSSLVLRDAETGHTPIVFSIGRHAAVTGK